MRQAYTREQLILIDKQIKRSEELEGRIPGSVAWLIAALLAVIISGARFWWTRQDVLAFVVGLAFVWFVYRVVAFWVVWTQLDNMPDHDEPPPPAITGNIFEQRITAPMVQTRRNQIKRANLTGILPRVDQSVLWYVMREHGRVSRPLLERHGVTGLTDYMPSGGTRLAALKRELEAAGMLVDNRVPEAVREDIG